MLAKAQEGAPSQRIRWLTKGACFQQVAFSQLARTIGSRRRHPLHIDDLLRSRGGPGRIGRRTATAKRPLKFRCPRCSRSLRCAHSHGNNAIGELLSTMIQIAAERSRPSSHDTARCMLAPFGPFRKLSGEGRCCRTLASFGRPE